MPGGWGWCGEVWLVFRGRGGGGASGLGVGAGIALAIGVAGAFLVLAAYHSDPSETRGLGEALESLQHQPLGSYMLGTIAVGLLLYGAFMFAVARYRRIEPA